MLFLANTTDKFQLITSAAATIDVHASWVDLNGTTVTPGRTNTAITTATTTDVVAAPGASTIRNLKQMFVRNKDATLACDVTLVFDQNGTDFEVFEVTLLAQETAVYIEGVGVDVIRPQLTDSALLTTFEPSSSQRIGQSALFRAAVATFVTISGTAYYVYVGRAARSFTAAFVEVHVTTAGAGAQTAEVGLFSTPQAPSKSTQTLTKIVATGTVDTLTTTGVKRNTTNFAQAIPAGTHLWAAYRGAMATTQITAAGLAGDMSNAQILTTTGGGALTGLSTAAGTIPTLGTATVAPDLRVTLS